MNFINLIVNKYKALIFNKKLRKFINLFTYEVYLNYPGTTLNVIYFKDYMLVVYSDTTSRFQLHYEFWDDLVRINNKLSIFTEKGLDKFYNELNDFLLKSPKRCKNQLYGVNSGYGNLLHIIYNNIKQEIL